MSMLRDAIITLDKIQIAGDVGPALREISNIIGAENIAYMASSDISESYHDTVRFVTYSTEWEKRYFDREYIAIDPIAQGIEKQLPFDWHFASNQPSTRWLFSEAESFGVGRQGLSVPIRGDAGERALITLTSFHSNQEWQKMRWHYQGFISALAPYLHHLALRLGKLQPMKFSLSERQRQCLGLYGRGNTPKQIAAQLGISGSMAREHLHRARRKLACPTISAAAIKAARLRAFQE